MEDRQLHVQQNPTQGLVNGLQLALFTAKVYGVFVRLKPWNDWVAV